jgi:hypothetical protein
VTPPQSRPTIPPPPPPPPGPRVLTATPSSGSTNSSLVSASSSTSSSNQHHHPLQQQQQPQQQRRMLTEALLLRPALTGNTSRRISLPNGANVVPEGDWGNWTLSRRDFNTLRPSTQPRRTGSPLVVTTTDAATLQRVKRVYV